MPRGDKRKYTGKQERKADHIAEGYTRKGVSKKEAKRRAWATVNKIHHGGERKGGGGYGKSEDRSPNRKGGQRGGRASAKRRSSSRSSSSRSGSRSGSASRSR